MVLLCFPGHYEGNRRSIIWGEMLNKELIYPFCFWGNEGWMYRITNTIWITQNLWGAQWACSGSSTEVATPFYYIATFCLQPVQWDTTGHSHASKEHIWGNAVLLSPGEHPWDEYTLLLAVRPPTLFWSYHRRPVTVCDSLSYSEAEQRSTDDVPDLIPQPSEFLVFFRSAAIPFSSLALRMQITSPNLPSRPINI